MSRSKMEKKLRTAKKTWKKLTNSIQSKFHALTISKSINAATRRLISAVQRSLRLLIPSKFRRRRLLSPKSSPPSYYRRNQNQYLREYDQHLHNQNNLTAIHIDELFGDPAVAGTSSRGKEVTEERNGKDLTADVYSIEDAWKIAVASSPHLRPVDERAEEFIRNFRREIVLDKEKSLLEFQQMLARSS